MTHTCNDGNIAQKNDKRSRTLYHVPRTSCGNATRRWTSTLQFTGKFLLFKGPCLTRGNGIYCAVRCALRNVEYTHHSDTPNSVQYSNHVQKKLYGHDGALIVPTWPSLRKTTNALQIIPPLLSSELLHMPLALILRKLTYAAVRINQHKIGYHLFRTELWIDFGHHENGGVKSADTKSSSLASHWAP